MKVITREQAKKENLITFYTGNPCIHGHLCVRYVKDGRCKDCLHEKSKRFADKLKPTKVIWYQANKEKEKARALKYYYENKDHVRQVQAAARKKRPYIHKNRIAKRRAAKLNATPKWANLQVIKNIYKNCPEGYEVDHMIPLQSDEVCGLHVENNLQYLTKKQNTSKGNKLMKEYTEL